MDFFDECVLAVLKDGKHRGFTALLGEVGFSHNTLQQHLERLVAQGLIVREKTTSNSFGRPKICLSCAIQDCETGHFSPSRSTC